MRTILLLLVLQGAPMALIPAGTLAFAAGETPFVFTTPSGAEIPPPASAPAANADLSNYGGLVSLDSGIYMHVGAANPITIYNALLAEVIQITLSPPRLFFGAGTNYTNACYVLSFDPDGGSNPDGDYEIRKINAAGAVVQTWTLVAADMPVGNTALFFAVSPDGNTAYIGGTFASVSAYDLVGETWDDTFITETGSGMDNTQSTVSLAVLRDGTIVSKWIDAAATHYDAMTHYVALHDDTGTLIDRFQPATGLTDDGAILGVFAASDNASFWWLWSEDFLTAHIEQIQISDADVLQTFTKDDGAFAWLAAAMTVVPVAIVPAAPIDYEDPCSITEPRVFATVDTGSEVLKFGVHPLRDNAAMGGFAEPRLIDVSPITKASSDPSTGAWSAQTASMKWADTDRANRARSETRTSLRNAPGEIYLTGNAQRLALGPPRILFSGKVYEDTADENLVLSTTLNDLIGVDYSLFSEEKLIPQRFVNASDFPAAGAQVLGFGVPIIGGEVKDLGNPPTGGTIDCPYVGIVDIGGTDYAASLVCGHAIKAFLTTAASTPPGGPSIWINQLPIDPAAVGVSVWAPAIPGDATWAAEFSSDQFTDINPGMLGPTRRYTLILWDPASVYGLAVIGGSTVHVDVQGMETVGDGTGTLITDYFSLYLHTLVNFKLNNYQFGAWMSIPQFLFSDGVTLLDRVDADSFVAASAVAAAITAGGYKGGFVIGAGGRRSSVRDVTKNFNFCGGCLLAQDTYGRLIVKVLNTNRTAFLNGHRILRDKVDFLPGFRVVPKADWQCNSWRSQYAQNYHSGLWDQGFAPVVDQDSIDRDGLIAKIVQYPYIRDAGTQAALDAYYVMLFKDMPRVAHYSRRGLCGLEDDVLDGLPITHYNGYGASGWVNNAVWVLSQTFYPKLGYCAFTALDVEPHVS